MRHIKPRGHLTQALCSEFGLDSNIGDKPAVTARAWGLKYKMAAGFSVDNLAEVVRGVKSGEVKAYTKSEVPPHNSVNAVKVTNTICANVQERMYQTSPKPVQETVSRQQCSYSSGQSLMLIINLLRSQGDLVGLSLNPERSRNPVDVVKNRVVSEASSATIPCKFLVVNERKCVTKAMNECDVPKEVPRTIFSFNTVKRRKCQDVVNTVCANANVRKCQISQMPVQVIAVK